MKNIILIKVVLIKLFLWTLKKIMLSKECFKIHIIEYRANQGNVFPKKSSYCKDHAIQGFVNQGPTVILHSIMS